MALTFPALRHFRDASLLEARGRRENADQLYGLAAECALKEAMSGLGLPLDAGGIDLERRYYHHVELFWDTATAFLSGRPGASLLAVLGGDRPFADWHVDQRYRLAPVAPAALARHADGAARAVRVLDAARLQGHLL
ncbi:MAG: hypothetical protein KC549_09835 [Myxococcales bacterium]|nr:hypothetical protein [Myxococcales bacterium]